MTDEHDDDKVTGYLRARGNVRVPDDALEQATARAVGAPAAHTPNAAVRGLSLGAAAVLVAVVALLVVNLPANVPVASSVPSNAALVPNASGQPHQSAETSMPPGTPASTTAPTQTPETANSPEPTTLAELPTTVFGMPVLTVAQAARLLDDGELNGQAVAVAGYFGLYLEPGCSWVSWNQLEQYLQPNCGGRALTDAQSDSILCHSQRNGDESCRSTPEGVPYLAPIFPFETGTLAWNVKGTRMVVIGHAGDPRLLQCPPDTGADCAKEFVVDRVVWADGHTLPLTAANPGMTDTISPRMSLDDVRTRLGLGDELLTGIAVSAKDVWMVEPRWNLAGDDIVWILRTLDPGQAASAQTSGETVSLVDDSTGGLLANLDLALSAGYDPARLRIVATAQGLSCCDDSTPFPFYRISQGGSVLHEGMFGGGQTLNMDDELTFEPGSPVVLDAGTYSVSLWLATVASDGTVGPPTGECTTQMTVNAGDEVLLSADFPIGGSCTFSPLSPYPSATPLP